MGWLAVALEKLLENVSIDSAFYLGGICLEEIDLKLSRRNRPYTHECWSWTSGLEGAQKGVTNTPWKSNKEEDDALVFIYTVLTITCVEIFMQRYTFFISLFSYYCVCISPYCY